MGKHIGLDIGIASVGWAVIDDDYSVVELGSNLFNSCEASNNVVRRQMRQSRRLLRRRKNRIRDFKIQCWEKYIGRVPKNLSINIVELKNKGLQEKLNETELYAVLLNYLKHRGISYLDEAGDEITGNSDYANGLKRNQDELITKFPCQIQKERLEKNDKYRGQNVVNDGGEKIANINVFTTSSYRKEINALLDCQQKNSNFVKKEFIDKYLEIFDRKREYFVGPGNDKSRTDYGIYTTKKNEEGKFITEKNLFDKLIGKCSVYKDEQRAPMCSYTAEEFNLLNDLNNITIEGEHLTEQEVKEIIKLVKNFDKKPVKSDEKNLIPKIIEKVTKRNKETIKGARINSDNDQIFHNFEFYRTLKFFLLEKNLKIEEVFTNDEIDIIAKILTLNTERDQILNELHSAKYALSITDDIANLLIDIRKKNASMFTKWHSFSIKLMKEIIPIMYETGKEQMSILCENGYIKSNVDKYKDLISFPINDILENIYNPVVRRSIRITFRILNALMKKYDDIEEISIEMPRDKNEDEEKKRIKDLQNKNEKELPFILNRISEEYGYTITLEEIFKIKSMPLKLKLWNEQNGKCIYSGKEINPIELIKDNRDKFEIDHIIPLSISFDDSRTNKVLVYGIENQEKGQRTPYYYLNKLSREFGFKEFKKLVNEIYKGSNYRKKRENLLFLEDINKIDVVRGFINRNINDTRYASKVVLNACNDFFAAHNRKIKVKVIRGAFTHNMRKNLDLNKNRDESYAHHAIDACLVSYSHMGYDEYEKIRKEKYIDIETGEIINEKLLEKGIDTETYNKILYQEKWKLISNDLKDAEKKVKYWHRIDKKCNRALLKKVTIYSTRIVDDKIKLVDSLNIRNIKEGAELKEIILNNKESLLMYKYDKQTFDNLNSICEKYPDAKNPFLKYEEENNDKVRKYAKNHKGPIITKVKYLSKNIESCFDISHKYGKEKGSKAIIQLEENRFRTDIFFDNEEKKYYFISIKYNDVKYHNNKIYFNKEKYFNILKKSIIKINNIDEAFDGNKIEFKFSLYRDSIFEFKNSNTVNLGRFVSSEPGSNKIEYKPIFAKDFESIGKTRQRPVMNRIEKIKKINTDILGNCYYVDNETFDGCFVEE